MRLVCGILCLIFHIACNKIDPALDDFIIDAQSHEHQCSQTFRMWHKTGSDMLSSGKTFGVVFLSDTHGCDPNQTYCHKGTTIHAHELLSRHLNSLENTYLKYGTPINLFFLTTEESHAAVEAFIAAQPRSFIKQAVCIKQGTCESITLDAYTNHYDTNRAIGLPLGNGGLFQAIVRSPAFDEIDALNVVSLNNAGTQILDPESLGAFYSNDLEILSRAVELKRHDKAGVYLHFEGALTLVDPTYIKKCVPEKVAYADTINHICTPAFIRKVAASKLPYVGFLKNKRRCKVEKLTPWSRLRINVYLRKKSFYSAFYYARAHKIMLVKRKSEYVPYHPKERPYGKGSLHLWH